MRLFDPVVPEDRLHPSFVGMLHPAREGCRLAMESTADLLGDPDGNFVEQFQTTAFDARVWELYLCAALSGVGLQVSRPGSRPDFLCVQDQTAFFVEAVTANPTDTPANPRPPQPTSAEEWIEQFEASNNDYEWLAIRLGSALYSKLTKRYDRLPHVEGHPFVLAIQNFGDVGALSFSVVPLLRYAFGVELRRDELCPDGLRKGSPLEKHEYEGKEIPSGFFRTAHSEHVSAVLFSNAGTVSKFTRMAAQEGLTPVGVRVERVGLEFDPTTGSKTPRPFRRVVDTQSTETWADDLHVIHNPNALHPLPRESWPAGMTHHELNAAGVVETRGPAHGVFASFTNVFVARDN